MECYCCCRESCRLPGRALIDKCDASSMQLGLSFRQLRHGCMHLVLYVSE
jgi:hypothetical protein